MEPLRILGIPITRPGYYYRNAMTLAQIELMAMDCSVVDYDYGSGKKKKMDTNERLREMEERGVDAEAARRAGEKWLEKYGDGNVSIELDLSGYDIPQQKKSYTLDDLKKISEQQKE